jgi:hypothetical protein
MDYLTEKLRSLDIVKTMKSLAAFTERPLVEGSGNL